MARKIRFILNDDTYEFEILKVDRSKLYGKKEASPVDEHGAELKKGYLDEWGCVVIHATGMGYLGGDNKWHDRSQLIATDSQGNKLEIRPSSFDGAIPLDRTASLEDYCEYEMSGFYLLKGDRAGQFIDLLDQIDGFLTFEFLFRAGHNPSTAFLNHRQGQLFMIVGKPAELEFIGKPQRVDVEEYDEEEEVDFGMF